MTEAGPYKVTFKVKSDQSMQDVLTGLELFMKELRNVSVISIERMKHD